tara:strand:+ start:62 stop:274 length:213 start_codon:yes stop_codon:yes gene_type:complete
MTNPNDQNALDFVRAKNKDKLYQATLKEVLENQKEKRPEWSLTELKVSHENHTLDNEISNVFKKVSKLNG